MSRLRLLLANNCSYRPTAAHSPSPPVAPRDFSVLSLPLNLMSPRSCSESKYSLILILFPPAWFLCFCHQPNVSLYWSRVFWQSSESSPICHQYLMKIFHSPSRSQYCLSSHSRSSLYRYLSLPWPSQFTPAKQLPPPSYTPSRSQWSSGYTLACCASGPRFESRCGQKFVFSRKSLRFAALGTGCMHTYCSA